MTFGIDGRTYEIDLGPKNAKKIRDFLAPYLEEAREVKTDRRGTKAPARSSRGTAADKEQNAAIREWAAKNGVEVGAKGRIPQDVVAQYEAAHK
ncbi:Lsr2 family protein [Glycomyces mayteni]|uniref:Lsr2 family protein n=1 Tax=Glycomyces mayteni TaxID=543887 RepID=A0ABW2D1Z6_9ACTN